MNDFNIDKERSRWAKEFVYEQWRKILTIFVIDIDVSRNDFTPSNVTSEKIRTIFNNGYKLAMLQTKQSLLDEIHKNEDENIRNLMEKLIDKIEDRIETQNLFITYKNKYDESLLSDAIKREAEFSSYLKSNMTKWGEDRSM